MFLKNSYYFDNNFAKNIDFDLQDKRFNWKFTA